MEIVVSYGDMLNPEFKNAFLKISETGLYSPKKADKMLTIGNRLYQAEQRAMKLKKELMDKFFATEEKEGKVSYIRTQEPPFFKFKEGVTREEFDKSWAELISLRTTIFKAKFDISEIPETVKLSPNDLLVLRPIISLSQEAEASLEDEEKTEHVEIED